ncbi:hypothetical protein [Streptomyces benahoarensis]|uniref:Uncharacterized protein n=1 Tax=Streptomyces benahoarensis TaxID=2595054 RepID=A0A553ZQ77_9ACTN|nr:hypothetical protein [Streptomyces benahoarensis]TSB32080.1 hypothetical protein FNJ62_03375 [Streptomyces benahoarensis]TSB43617.1 hypothetical protein FNZ23_03425 [Streptomyces benahoarensis]
MTTPAPYEFEIREGDDGATHPVEQLWTPCAGDAVASGFIAHRDLFVIGIDDATDDHLYPVGFIVLGHQPWADITEAATAYMSQIHGWRTLRLYPGDDPSVFIPRIPRAVLTHGVFLRHPHSDHGCGCEWGETWRMVWAPATAPGAIPVTAMRHPAAPATAGDLPNPDEGAPATWAV